MAVKEPGAACCPSPAPSVSSRGPKFQREEKQQGQPVRRQARMRISTNKAKGQGPGADGHQPSEFPSEERVPWEAPGSCDTEQRRKFSSSHRQGQSTAGEGGGAEKDLN